MSLLLIIIHVFVCLALILIVLLQTGKGADMGAAFGGGASQTLFGATGASTFLSKATTAAAVIFMLTSVVLAYRASDRPSGSLMSDEPPALEQKSETAPAAPASDASGTGDTSPGTAATPEATAPAVSDQGQGTQPTGRQ